MSNLSSIFGNTGFNAASVAPTNSFEPIPKGKYPVIVSASEVKQTKDRSGEYLQLTLEVIDGQYKGRKVWSRLNIRNRSKEAEDIAHRTLSALCHATGVMNLTASEQLHNIPVMADVKVKDDQNEVVTFAAMNGVPAAPKFQPSQPVQTAGSAAQNSPASNVTASPSNGAAVPPWKRSSQ